MYWLQPPPVARRIAAVCLVIGAVAWDLAEARTVEYPVAAAPIAAGTEITPDLVGWVNIPIDTLPSADPIGNVTAVPIGIGEPLTGSVVAGSIVAPDGWWTVPVVVGTIAGPGDEVLLVVADPPLSVIGVVVEAQVGDAFDLGHRPASVAVPPEAAPIVAAAEQQGLLVSAIRPGGTGE